MPKSATGEVRAADFSAGRRWLIIAMVSMGSSTIYAPAYLKNTFYNAQMDALHINNTQVGQLLSAFAWTAVACYLFSGIIADRVRMRTLMAVGFISTAILTFWYALLPSYTVLIFIFIGMGVTTILLWWGCRYKLVRLVSKEEEYSRNIGISYGFYGVAGLVVGLIGTAVLGAFSDDKPRAFQVFLFVIGALLAVLGVLSIFFIPKFEGEIAPTDSAVAVVVAAFKTLANPVVLLTSLTMFFVYFFYTCTSYSAPYMTALGANENLTNIISVVRQFGVTLLAGPIFGALAFRAKRPSIVIWIGSLLAAGAYAVIAIMPSSKGSIMGILVLAIALGFISNGVFGIVSGQLTEGKVPLGVFGAATGMVSLVGFFPDTISGPWLGSIMDNAEKAGDATSAYPTIFWILAAFAVLAALSAFALQLYVKANKTKLDAAYEAAVDEAAQVAKVSA